MFLVIPLVEFLHVLGVDINVHHENPATFLCHVSVSSVKRNRHRFASSRWHPVLTPGAQERHETPTGEPSQLTLKIASLAKYTCRGDRCRPANCRRVRLSTSAAEAFGSNPAARSPRSSRYWCRASPQIGRKPTARRSGLVADR